ncbi:MAG: aminotransferase class I/II-fold pyridoxal phosphate-dependent enzyme [Candidatus Nealsonbacteria bacterium]|nr:aminotransferase class I/II-fold pyridoxal phosphate-dependent enzyme [Candidatus Nealsonbacteria bacterium]
MDPILISLSPNTEKDDVLLALKLLFKPWLWKKNNRAEKLEESFRKRLPINQAIAFNSGRTALLAILESLNLEKGSEVLLQAFTCNAVVNPVRWTGFKPVFVDINEKTLNIDPVDLERKISPASRVILVQHTFGLAADMEKVSDICQKYNLILIEDCAHSLGATDQGKRLGTLGKAAFFSFGRDKVISSVYGGLAATDDDELGKKLKEFQSRLPQPSHFWIYQQLLHPVLTNLLVIPLYGLAGMGKWLLLCLQRIGLLSKAVRRAEKRGEKPAGLDQKMPDALIQLAENQFQKLDRFIAHQKEIARLYDENLANPELILPPARSGRIYLRYPLLLKNGKTDKMLDEARRKGIFLDDGWRKTVITPPDTDQARMGYRAGECPVAERTAQRILNLPTHINVSEKKARRIVDFLNNYHGD